MRPAPRLLVVNDLKPDVINAPADGFTSFLDESDSPSVRRRVGIEHRVERRLIDHRVIDVMRGETSPSSMAPGATVTRWRLLMRDHRASGRIVGALDFTVLDRAGDRKSQVVVSSVVVEQRFRRQGVATMLVDTLLRLHSSARVDSRMTDAGAAFFGFPQDRTRPTDARAARP